MGLCWAEEEEGASRQQRFQKASTEAAEWGDCGVGEVRIALVRNANFSL